MPYKTRSLLHKKAFTIRSDSVHTVIKRCNLVPRVLSTWRESLRRRWQKEKKNQFAVYFDLLSRTHGNPL